MVSIDERLFDKNDRIQMTIMPRQKVFGTIEHIIKETDRYGNDIPVFILKNLNYNTSDNMKETIMVRPTVQFSVLSFEKTSDSSKTSVG